MVLQVAAPTRNQPLGKALENRRLEQLPLDGRGIRNIVATTVPDLEGNVAHRL
jgi:hypothetical protein